MKSLIRVRISAHDVHYGGDLVDGAHVMGLFGDACTEICILHDGDEGLSRAYREIEFLAPIRAGDFVEVRAELTHVGQSSREVRLTAHKVIEAAYDDSPSRAEALPEPLLVCHATAICVVPPDKQRGQSARTA